MAATTGDISPSSGLGTWRTPMVIIICGCLIALLSFGPRSSLGFFVQPMSRDFAWGRDVFGLALALQNLLWGLGQPIAGAIADRFGIVRVMIIGALLYAGGLLLMRYSTAPLSLDLGAGVLIGFGLSGCSFNLVLSAFSKLLPPEKRGFALGAGTAAGSFGQFLFAPFGVAMIDNFGWEAALTVFASDALDRAAIAGDCDAASTSSNERLSATSNRSRPRWRRRSAIAPTCCWFSASSPAGSSSPSSRFTFRLTSSTADSRSRSAASATRDLAGCACTRSSTRSAGSSRARPSRSRA
jgi:MFS family permease